MFHSAPTPAWQESPNAAWQRVRWGSSSGGKCHTGECSMQGPRILLCLRWGVEQGGGCRYARLVPAWDSDEEASVHRQTLGPQANTGAWTSGGGSTTICQSAGKPSCPAVDSSWGIRPQQTVQGRAGGNTGLAHMDSRALAKTLKSHKGSRGKAGTLEQWAFTPQRLN